MKLFKLKRKNIILVSLLAIAGFLGISSVAVNTATSKEAPVAEKAEASYSAGDILYLDTTTNWSEATAKYRIHVRWQTDPSGGSWSSYGEEIYQNFYKIVLPEYGSPNYLYIVREDPNNSSNVWNSLWRVGEITKNSVIKVTGWSSYTITGSANVTCTAVYGSSTANKTFPVGNNSSYKTDVSRFNNYLNDYYGYTKSNTYYNAKTGGSIVTQVYSATTIYNRYTATSTKTIYFDAGSLSGTYSTPYIYAFTSTQSTGYNADFPGVAMSKRSNTQRSIYGGYVYTATIPSNASVIFSPGSSSGQTGDISASSITSGMTYLINTLGVGNWYSSIDVSFVNQDTSVTTTYYAYKNGSSPIGFNTPALSKEGYTASWNTSPSGTGTNYNQNAYISGFTSNTTLYSKFTLNTYTITYYKVMNGTYMDWWGTSTVSAEHFQKYSDIEPAEIYGYGFEGWYSDSSCTTGIGSNTITGNATVYAKYTSDPSNHTYYVGLPSGNCYDNVTYGGALRVWYSNGEDEPIRDAPAHRINGITSTNLYMVSIPTDVSWFAFHSGLSNYSMQNGHRTVSVGPDTDFDAGSNNLFLCKNETTTAYDGGTTEYIGEWTTCYFQFQTASNSGFTSDLTRVDMSEPSNFSSGNDAEAIGVNGKASYYFRVAVVINGSESYLTTVGTDSNTSACTATSGSNRFVASDITINVYLKNNVIYLLDTSDIDAGGYLYISSGDSLTDIKITVSIKDSSGTTVYPFSSSKLSTVTNSHNTTTLTFNSVEGLIKLPIYNLRGELTPDKSKQSYYAVTFNSNSTVNIPIATTNTDYYMSSLAATPTTTSAPAASVAYLMDAAVSNASNKSVCNIDATTAKSICDKYDALTSTEKATFGAASISTWDSAKPTYSGNRDVPMTAILYQVSKIANDGTNRGSLGRFGSFSLFGSEDNFSTIIIIISSSVALLSVTALSILVIRKRKSKED